MNRTTDHKTVVFAVLRSPLLVVFSAVIIMLITLFDTAKAEDLEMINRPVNSSGLTGLLFTTSPFTVPFKSVELAAIAISEKSTVPDYTLNELPAISLTAGITPTMELAVRGSYFQKTMNKGIKQRGTGDTELSYKWNFLQQNESSMVPALAVLVTGVAATSDKNADIPGFTHWGARFGLSAGKEIILGDHVLGVYADGQIVVHDLSVGELRDRFGIINTGLLFPVSKDRNLQMLVEYNMVTGVDRITMQGGDYSAITYGLRLVNERFNLSIGAQFVHKQVEGFDNSSRVIGMMSIKL